MIEKSAFLVCAPARAFTLFTERASDWWPEGLRHTSDPRSEIRMLADGRFWERAGDGHEVELGRVLVWEPAQRLILDFYPGTDAEHPTEVVVRFARRTAAPASSSSTVPSPRAPTCGRLALRASSAPGHSSCRRSSRPPTTTSVTIMLRSVGYADSGAHCERAKERT